MIAPTGFFADYGCHVRIQGHARALQARGHAVLLATYPGGREVAGITTVRPPLWNRGREMPVGSSWRKFVLDSLLAPVVWQAARRWRPHLIHAYLHEGAMLGAVLPFVHHVPLVFDFQGSLVSEMLDHRFLVEHSPWLPAWQRLETWIDHRPQAILASSQHAVDLLRTHFRVPGVRVHHLADSIDPQMFRPASTFAPDTLDALRRQLGLPAGRPVVVYLGLLAPYQGIDLLLHAIRRLLTGDGDRPRPFFLLMGFPHVAHYRTQAQCLGLANDVLFTGAIPFDQAPLYLALGQVAVAPKISATEGSGKLLTYMAAALPVAAFDTPVHREVLADCGVYAPIGDVAGLACALAHLLHDTAYAQATGATLRQRVIDRFTWDHAATVIESTYAQITPKLD
jgi:glycosyltransferase involved in cell wall biosynthesis